MGAAGKEAMPYPEWFLAEKNSDDSDGKSAKKEKELKSARKISAKRKAELEAAMNAIP